MGGKFSSGFTIIETTLFLAVSGVLVATMIAGVSVSLNAQRYKDATDSLKNLVQQQYADLSSVQNGRDNTWSCATNATQAQGGITATNRGQSNCIVVGKYMRIESSDIAVYTVLASQTSTSAQTSDLAYMRNNYVYNVVANDVYETTLEWGTEIAWPVEGSGSRSPVTPRSVGILFLRSPNSGRVYTFSDNNVPARDSITNATFAGLLSAANESTTRSGRVICVLSDGLMIGNRNDSAVYVRANASNANAVEVITNDLSGSTGQKCGRESLL